MVVVGVCVRGTDRAVYLGPMTMAEAVDTLRGLSRDGLDAVLPDGTERTYDPRELEEGILLDPDVIDLTTGLPRSVH